MVYWMISDLRGLGWGLFRGGGGQRAIQPLREEVPGLVWGLLTRRLRGPAVGLSATSHLLHLSLSDLGPPSISTSWLSSLSHLLSDRFFLSLCLLLKPDGG